MERNLVFATPQANSLHTTAPITNVAADAISKAASSLDKAANSLGKAATTLDKAAANLTNKDVLSLAKALTAGARTQALKPLQWLQGYYGSVLGKAVSLSQTMLITATELAFILAVFPVSAPLLLRLGAAATFALLLRECKKRV